MQESCSRLAVPSQRPPNALRSFHDAVGAESAQRLQGAASAAAVQLAGTRSAGCQRHSLQQRESGLQRRVRSIHSSCERYGETNYESSASSDEGKSNLSFTSSWVNGHIITGVCLSPWLPLQSAGA